MKKSTTEYLATQDLHNRIDRVLDVHPTVKIRKLDNGSVQVNNYFINNKYGQWDCSGFKFYRRKSAVGYALCLVNNDIMTADEIKKLDCKLLSLKNDIDIYYYHMKKAKSSKAITMSNRISSDMPKLRSTDNLLTQLLKTITV